MLTSANTQVRDRAPLPRAAAGRRLLLPPHRHRRHLTNQEQMRRGSRTYQQVSPLFSINTMVRYYSCAKG